MTILEAAAALRSRRISCVELLNDCLQQIEQLNPKFNAFLTVCRETATGRAAALDKEFASGIDRGLLHGIPIAHKDLVWTKGIPTTSGSKLFQDFIPDRNAPVAEKLETAGAVMLGKTGLHELAYGVTSDNPHFGAIRNPHDPERTPGGSSGGSGVAVATGMALMATGTDTGGSIRIPASFCGVVGLKPTYGLLDRTGIEPLGFTLDHVGPLTATVADANVTFTVLAEDTPRRPAPFALNEIRIGLPENFFFTQVDPEIRDAVHRMARRAGELGAKVVPVRVPDMDALNAAGRVILLSEASALYEPYLNQRDQFGADVLALLDQGRLIPAIDYVNAQRLRKTMLDEFRGLFRSIDCLFTPTTPIVAPRIGQRHVEIDGESIETRLAISRFTRGMNVLGFPALSMPCGRNRESLPVGLQIIARPLEENLLFLIGEALERPETMS